jgi:predicted nucleic acid-binding protein
MGKLKIYFDNCCYGRPFDNQNDAEIYNETQAKMSIQSLVKYKAVELVYSSISVEEIAAYPFEENRNAILEFIEGSASYYIGKDNCEAAITLTGEIMETGIKLKDASHVACAILAKCDYFITADKRLLKYQDNRIKIVNPVKFLEIWRAL